MTGRRSTEAASKGDSIMERQFFSGNTVEQAILAAARHHGLDPSRVAYKLRDKKHGFLNIRRRVVIEVDPAAPEQAEDLQPPPSEEAESGFPRPRAEDRRPAPRNEDRGQNQWHGAETSWSGEGEPEREIAAIEQALEVISRLLGMHLESSIERTEEGFEIELSGEDSDLLVEDGGRALGAIEHLLPRMVRGFLGHGFPCRVDCDGFRAAHERELRQLAEEVAEGVRRELRDQILEPMNPADRRLVHLALADDPTVETESEGQGFLKRVRISPAYSPLGGS